MSHAFPVAGLPHFDTLLNPGRPQAIHLILPVVPYFIQLSIFEPLKPVVTRLGKLHILNQCATAHRIKGQSGHLTARGHDLAPTFYRQHTLVVAPITVPGSIKVP